MEELMAMLFDGKFTFWSLPSAPVLPKFKAIPWPCKLEGGRPPLAAGVGIGEGECAGDVMRGFVMGGVESDVFCGLCGTLFAIAGEPPAFIEPKVILARLLDPLAPPFGMYPCEGAIVTDDFRP